MTMDTKTQAAIAVAGLAFTAAFTTGVIHNYRKNRTCKPLPGTTKVERIYIIQTTKKK